MLHRQLYTLRVAKSSDASVLVKFISAEVPIVNFFSYTMNSTQLIAVAVASVILSKKKTRKRSVWTKEWLLKR